MPPSPDGTYLITDNTADSAFDCIGEYMLYNVKILECKIIETGDARYTHVVAWIQEPNTYSARTANHFRISFAKEKILTKRRHHKRTHTLCTFWRLWKL